MAYRARLALVVSAIAVAGAISGCRSKSTDPSFGLAVTLSFDPSVDDATLARVDHLSFRSSGDETYARDVSLGRAAARSERVPYIPLGTTRALVLEVTAVDALGNGLAAGMSAATVEPGKFLAIGITLSAQAVAPDGGLFDGNVFDGDMVAGDLLDGSMFDGTTPCVGFCDAFDDRMTLQGAWSSLTVKGVGSTANGTISSAASISPPQAAAFHSPAYAAATGDGLILQVDRSLSGAKMTVDLDVKIVGYTGGTGFANLVGFSAAGHFTGGFSVESATKVAVDYFVQAPDGGINHPIGFISVQDGAWHHLHFVELFDAAAGSVYATYDSTTVYNVTNVQTWAWGALPTTMSVWIGTLAQGQTSAFDVYFDNVQVH